MIIKLLSSIHMLCKQTQPVQLTHFEKNARPTQSIPTSCLQIIIEKPHNLDTAIQKWSPMS